jgi:hypothetical protein
VALLPSRGAAANKIRAYWAFRKLPPRTPGYLYRLEKFREKRRIEEDQEVDGE